MLDQLINLLIGIVGGIISGVMVTLYYRHMDEKRDLLRYFRDFQAYIQQFIATCTIDEMEDFTKKVMPPKQFDWVRPSAQESKIINDALWKITEISDLLGKRKQELLSIAEGRENRSEVDCETEYWYKINRVNLELLGMRHDIYGLGNPLYRESYERFLQEQQEKRSEE